MSFAEKTWDNLKKSHNIILKNDDTLEKTNGNWKIIYKRERKIAKKIESVFPDSLCTCVKIKEGNEEEYRLFFENKKNIKVIRIICQEEKHTVKFNFYEKTRERASYISSYKILEKDKLLMNTFYDEIVKQNHIRLKVLTKNIKRENGY